jgi:AraC family transcriptional regulator, positive regulator of tynA and feaB
MTLNRQTCRPVSSAEIEEYEYFWRRTVQDRLATLDLRPTGGYPRFGSVDQYDLGDLAITDWDCPGLEALRSSSMARRDADAVLIFSVFAGRQIIETADQTVIQRRGGILIMSTRSTVKVVVPETVRKRSVRIPLTALSPFDTGPGVPDCLLLDIAQHPLASLAHSFLLGVDRQVGQMSRAEVEGARNALLVLIAGMIRATRTPNIGDAEFMPALRDRLEAWIVDRLALGAIKVRDLAGAHNIAPRTVHRAFATTGDTVGSVVRAHRLAAVRSDLVHTTSSIAAIAHRWGFCDSSHLGREFRREFSMSPGDYREAHSMAGRR